MDLAVYKALYLPDVECRLLKAVAVVAHSVGSWEYEYLCAVSHELLSPSPISDPQEKPNP